MKTDHFVKINELIYKLIVELNTQERIDEWWNMYIDTIITTNTGASWTDEEIAKIRTQGKLLFQRGYEAGTAVAVADILGRSVSVEEMAAPMKKSSKVIN